jgi:hypothetical protein
MEVAFFMKKTIFLSLLFLLISSVSLYAAPKSDLWDIWDQSGTRTGIDHTEFQVFLDNYVLEPATGPTLVKYEEALGTDLIHNYVEYLESIVIRQYTKAEQFAYWVNLYNAATIKIILDEYPVKSIREIKSGLFSSGPWDMKFLKVEGEDISLNDIEHRILRPIWNDARIHYAVNCASFSCPSLSTRAFTADNNEEILNKLASDYVNAPRALRLEGNTLILSSIYDWYQVDFGSDSTQVLEHINKYRQNSFVGEFRRIKYEYDWTLNEAR